MTDLVNDLRRQRDKLETKLKANAENLAGQDGPRPSALAMEQSEKFKGTVPEPTSAQQQEAKKNIEDLATERANNAGKPKTQLTA